MTRWLCALVAAVPLAAGRGAEPPGSPSPAPNVAATVNGEVIRLDQVDAVVRRTATADGPLTEAQARRLRQEVVQDLIDDALLKQFLRDHGPAVEPAELEKHFRALAVSLQRKGKTLADFYRETGQTEEQVRDTWATLFRFQKYVDRHAPEAELRKFYEANKDFFDGT